MAQTYAAKGKIFLTQSQFDARKKAGALQTGVEYMIIGNTGAPNILYGTDANSEDTSIAYDVEATPNTIPMRDSNGHLRVLSPSESSDAVPKEYVDNLIDYVDCVALQGNNLDSDGNLYIDWQSDLANHPGVCYDITTVGQFNKDGCPVITVGLPNEINLTSCHIDILNGNSIHINGTFTHSGSTTPIDEFYEGDLTGKKIFITPGTGTGYAIIRTRYINGII